MDLLAILNQPHPKFADWTTEDWLKTDQFATDETADVHLQLHALRCQLEQKTYQLEQVKAAVVTTK